MLGHLHRSLLPLATNLCLLAEGGVDFVVGRWSGGDFCGMRCTWAQLVQRSGKAFDFGDLYFVDRWNQPCLWPLYSSASAFICLLAFARI